MVVIFTQIVLARIDKYFGALYLYLRKDWLDRNTEGAKSIVWFSIIRQICFSFLRILLTTIPRRKQYYIMIPTVYKCLQVLTSAYKRFRYWRPHPDSAPSSCKLEQIRDTFNHDSQTLILTLEQHNKNAK